MLRAFREHSNPTLHSHHSIFHVCVVLFMFHTTGNDIGDSGAESISIALQSNTSLTSLDISGVYCVNSCFTQQITILGILVLRVFREHFNQTLHSNHLIFQVCCVIHTCFTQQITKLEILVLRAFREHSNQTLHSHHSIFQVCVVLFMFHTTGNDIGYSGAESISRALQSNTSLTSLKIRCVLFC